MAIAYKAKAKAAADGTEVLATTTARHSQSLAVTKGNSGQIFAANMDYLQHQWL